MTVIFDLVDQMTSGPRFCQLLQIFSLLQRFLLDSFFNGISQQVFYLIQIRNNLRPNINCQLYVDIITRNYNSDAINEFVHQNFKRTVYVEEIDEVAKVMIFLFLLPASTSRYCSDHDPAVTPVKSQGASV